MVGGFPPGGFPGGGGGGGNVPGANPGTGGDGADGVVIIRYKKKFAGLTVDEGFFIN